MGCCPVPKIHVCCAGGFRQSRWLYFEALNAKDDDEHD